MKTESASLLLMHANFLSDQTFSFSDALYCLVHLRLHTVLLSTTLRIDK
jgi:hypothetical protein